MRQQKYKEAFKRIQEADSLGKKPWTKRNLAYYLACCPLPEVRNEKRGLTLALEALDEIQESEPHSNVSFCWEVIAKAYSANEQFEIAHSFLRKAKSAKRYLTDLDRDRYQIAENSFDDKVPFTLDLEESLWNKKKAFNY